MTSAGKGLQPRKGRVEVTRRKKREGGANSRLIHGPTGKKGQET